MNQATQLEVMAELAALIAYTNQTLHIVSKNLGHVQMATRAALAEQQCLNIQHQLKREASQFEASEMVDPFEAA